MSQAVFMLWLLVEIAMKNTDTCKIPMDESIFGRYYEEEVIKEQINELFEDAGIGGSVICIYIRYSK